MTESRLTLLYRIPKTRPSKAVYRCACGTEKELFADAVKRGRIKSCGCLAKEMAGAKMREHRDAFTRGNPRHNLCHTGAHVSWSNMIQRCTNPKRHNYRYYGGRGISIDQRWLVFENFYADMGERPAHTSLERVDNDRDYGPQNCVWADARRQATNRRPRGTAS